MKFSLWSLPNVGHHRGSHYPLWCMTKNQSRRSPEKYMERTTKKQQTYSPYRTQGGRYHKEYQQSHCGAQKHEHTLNSNDRAAKENTKGNANHDRVRGRAVSSDWRPELRNQPEAVNAQTAGGNDGCLPAQTPPTAPPPGLPLQVLESSYQADEECREGAMNQTDDPAMVGMGLDQYPHVTHSCMYNAPGRPGAALTWFFSDGGNMTIASHQDWSGQKWHGWCDSGWNAWGAESSGNTAWQKPA